MSFGIDNRKLKRLLDLYRPNNQAEEMKYLVTLKGEDDLFINLETCPFQGISVNSIEDRRTTFGSNQLTHKTQSVFMPLYHSISQPYICLSLFLSVICFILETSGVGYGQGSKSFIMVLVAVLNWVLVSLQRFWFQQRSSKIPHFLEQNMATAVRQNRQERIPSSEVVVGDMLQIKEGDIIPADGWLIEGKNLQVSELHISTHINSRKSTFRDCLTQLKQKMEERRYQSQKVTSECSPALIGGSLVQAGYGRMIVLCVGNLSRRGALLQYSQLKYKKNYCRSKVEQLANSACNKLLVINLVFIAFQILKLVARAGLAKNLSILGEKQEWKELMAVLWVLVIGLPQGLQLGLMCGLWFLKAKLYWVDKIWVDYCQDMTKMANVNLICFDREFQAGKTVYRQWWNQQNHQFYKEVHQDQKGIQNSCEGQLQVYQDLDEDFRQLFTKALLFKQCKQPNQGYIVAEDVTLNKSYLSGWQVFYDMVGDLPVRYICENQIIKFVLFTFEKENDKVYMVLGNAQEMLNNCDTMMSKTTGEIKDIPQQLSLQIRFTHQSMNRRFMSTSIISYFTADIETTLEQDIELLKTTPMTFLTLIGASGIKQHSQYQNANRIREAGIKLMLVSNCPLEDAVIRSKHIGVNGLDQETLALTGEEYLNLVGDVHCSDCKKSICVCQVKFVQPKVKNKAQLRHVQRSFRVVGQASSQNKYALMVGLDNIDYNVAFMGYAAEDRPALAYSYMPISVGPDQLQGYSASFKKNSVRSLSRLIVWSRFAHQFVKRYIQLIVPASLVSVAVVMLGALASAQLVFGIVPITWVFAVLCPLLALALSWETPSQGILHESITKYQKDSPLLTQSIKKQITSQLIWQTLVLFTVMLTGHAWIPEISDEMDSIIGSDWSAKYSNSDKTLVASGLYSNPLLDSTSYRNSFNTYGMGSRHLTIVFNIFALMQIFNCLNCRKVKDILINILEGIQIQTVLILLLAYGAHRLFIMVLGQATGLYPYGLTLIQEFISIGIAATVWLVSFVVRLLPQSPYSSKTQQVWVNRSINLGVKLVAKTSKLTEFQIEEEIQLKNQ